MLVFPIGEGAGMAPGEVVTVIGRARSARA